jgi:hypothetical protein
VTDDHQIEQQLTAVLERRATEATPSPDGLQRIEARGRARRRQRIAAIAAGVVLLCVIAAAVVTPRGGGGGAELDVVDDSETEGSIGLPGGELLPALVTLEAALEEEMIIGAAYLGSEGTSFATELDKSIAATDGAIATVEEGLAAYDPSTGAPESRVDELDMRIEDLAVIREGTRTQQLSALVQTRQYGETIDAALEVQLSVSTDATSTDQAVTLNQAATLAFAGRQDTTVGAVLAAAAASPEQQFVTENGQPCATLDLTCASWADFSSAILDRDDAVAQLSDEGRTLTPPIGPAEQSTAEVPDQYPLALDAPVVVNEAVANVGWYSDQVLELLDQAASMAPTTTLEGVRKVDLDLYLAAVELEREWRRASILAGTGDVAAINAQSPAVTAATTRFDEAWVAAGRAGAFSEQTTDVPPPTSTPFESQIGFVDRLGALRRELAAQVDDPALFQRLDTINRLLDGQRDQAEALAILSVVISRDPQQMTDVEGARLSEQLTLADESFVEWDRQSTPQHQADYRNTVSAPEVRAAEDLIELALLQGQAGMPLGIDVADWQLARQNLVDAYESLEYLLIDALDDPGFPEPGVPPETVAPGD